MPVTAKRIQISPDNRTNWYTFPGDKGEFNTEATGIKDTILGQTFQSEQTGMLNWTISTNGVYKGFAGYVATIKKSGTPTTLTATAMSLVSGKTYKVTDATKNVLDRLTAVTVLDNAVAVSSANILSIDYLFGQVTFVPGYTPTGPITLTGKYLPMTQVAKANSFTLTQTANALKVSVFETAQANGGYDTYDYGLRTVGLSLKGIFSSTNGFAALVQARAEMVIELSPDGAGNAVARGFFKPMATNQSGNVGDNEEQDLNFSLSVPDQSNILTPFTWTFASSTSLNRAVREAILAWQNATIIDVNYLEDGTNGHAGDAIVTDVSLSGGLDVMNDFTIKFQGSDAPVTFP